jgi:membrane protease YdiL (CAAX protease family)
VQIFDNSNVLLFALFVYPVLEEIVFRWGLLHYLDTSFILRIRFLGVQHTKWLNNIFTSVVFTMSHLGFWYWQQAVLVFFPSLFLGWLWQRFHNLLLCISVHTFMNTFYLFVWLPYFRFSFLNENA